MMQPKSSILHIISSLEVGGAEKMLISLLRSANKNSHVDYICVVVNQRYNETLKQELIEIGIPIYFLNRPEGEKNPKYLVELYNIIRKHNVNVIHTHDMGARSMSIIMKLFKWSLKLVYTFHDTGWCKNLTPINRWLHSYIIDTNITISPAVESECHTGSMRNTKMIYNGIDLSEFTMKHTPILTLQDKPIQIIQVARIMHEKKGQDVLLRALALCKAKGLPFHCRFVGVVYPDTQASFEFLLELTKELGLESDVTFITDCLDPRPLLRESDIFVLSSRYEGFGLVILEAFASGTPVIATNIDGPKELIRHGLDGLLFEIDDEIALSHTLCQLMMNREERLKLSRNAEKTVKQYDISVMQQEYEKVYFHG